jgi:hypothetical protein
LALTATQTVKQAPESVQAIGASVGAAVTDALLPMLTAIRDESVKRHDANDSAQTALDLATVATADLKHLTRRVDALLGDGSGDNGQIASMQKTIRKTETDVTEIKGDMKTVLTALAKQETITSKSSSFMDGWKGVAVAIAVAASCFTLIGGIIAVVVWLYKH